MVDIKINDADQDTIVNTETNSDEDKIRFSTAGSERMIIDSNGNVGIGTNSPGGTLEISKSSGDPTIVFDVGGTDKFVMGVDDTDDNFKIGVGSLTNTALYIDSSERVGIGTSPDSAAKLQVEGQIKIVDGHQGAGKVLTSDSNGLAEWSDNTTLEQPVGIIMPFAGVAL